MGLGEYTSKRKLHKVTTCMSLGVRVRDRDRKIVVVDEEEYARVRIGLCLGNKLT